MHCSYSIFYNIHLEITDRNLLNHYLVAVGPARSMFVIGMLMAGADLKKYLQMKAYLAQQALETSCCTGIFSFDSEDQQAGWNSCRRAADSVDSISCSNNTGSIYGDTDEPDLWE